MAMRSAVQPPLDADTSELVDLRSLPEAQRVAFYGSMFAIAAVDGDFARDEFDVIFETIDTTGLSEHGRHLVWDSLVETPRLADCLAHFSASNDRVRCTLMVHLMAVAFADHTLAASEDVALLQARRALHINQQQIQAIERYMCDVGLLGARPSHDHKVATWLQYGAGLLMVLSIPAAAVYLLGTTGGIRLVDLPSPLAQPSFGLTLVLGAGTAIAVGAAAFLAGRWLESHGYRRGTRRARERRQRAQLAVQNLQEAIDHLATRTTRLAAVDSAGAPEEDAAEVSAVYRMLQDMLAQRQATSAAAPSAQCHLSRISPL